MRIRTIKPDFFLNEDLADLPPATRLAFIGLWCAADREGRFKWKPRKLKVQIIPWDNVNFQDILEHLVTAGMVKRYEVDGAEYGFIPGFSVHQRVQTREAQSTLPAPPKALQVQCNGNAGAMPGHCSAEGEGKGREGKGRERIYTGEKSPVDHPEILQRILAIFRKKKGNTTRQLDAQEARAWEKVQDTIQEADLELVTRFYSEPKSRDCDQTWKRKMAPAQLMNQWNSQVDLAAAFYEGKEESSEW